MVTPLESTPAELVLAEKGKENGGWATDIRERRLYKGEWMLDKKNGGMVSCQRGQPPSSGLVV